MSIMISKNAARDIPKGMRSLVTTTTTTTVSKSKKRIKKRLSDDNKINSMKDKIRRYNEQNIRMTTPTLNNDLNHFLKRAQGRMELVRTQLFQYWNPDYQKNITHNKNRIVGESNDPINSTMINERPRKVDLIMDSKWWRYNIMFALLPSFAIALYCETKGKYSMEHYHHQQELNQMSLIMGNEFVIEYKNHMDEYKNAMKEYKQEKSFFVETKRYTNDIYLYFKKHITTFQQHVSNWIIQQQVIEEQQSIPEDIISPNDNKHMERNHDDVSNNQILNNNNNNNVITNQVRRDDESKLKQMINSSTDKSNDLRNMNDTQVSQNLHKPNKSSQELIGIHNDDPNQKLIMSVDESISNKSTNEGTFNGHEKQQNTESNKSTVAKYKVGSGIEDRAKTELITKWVTEIEDSKSFIEKWKKEKNVNNRQQQQNSTSPVVQQNNSSFLDTVIQSMQQNIYETIADTFFRNNIIIKENQNHDDELSSKVSTSDEQKKDVDISSKQIQTIDERGRQ